MKHFFTFSINNRGALSLYQSEHDGSVTVCHSFPHNQEEKLITITPGDMVMLINLYIHVKDNNIQNDFINPCGQNRE